LQAVIQMQWKLNKQWQLWGMLADQHPTSVGLLTYKTNKKLH